jgi:hypothetical protein
MPKTKFLPRFSIGDNVRVRSGVCDPDYDELTIGGWAGTVGEVERGSPPTCLVRWNRETLKSQSSIYRKRCERDGFDGEEMWLGEDDLEPDTGGPIKIEQPKVIVTNPLSLDNQDDRIRGVFGLTSDDPLPDVDFDSLLAYHQHLSGSLFFPFEAKYSHETGPFQMTTRHITVTRLGEAEEPWVDDMYGLICQAREGCRSIDVPLCDLEVKKRSPNRRFVADYSYWISNYR